MYAYRQPSTPPVVKNIIIANCVALLATTLLPFGDELLARFALFNIESPFFHSYQIFTYMFLHGGISHLFFNMFALWMFGRHLEYELGSQRFFTYYMVCGVGAALLQLGVGYTAGRTGVGVYEQGTYSYYEHEKIAKGCHGTGDVYASAFVGAYMNGKPAYEAAKIAADYTVQCIKNTQGDPDHWYGVKFEEVLPDLIKSLFLANL